MKSRKKRKFSSKKRLETHPPNPEVVGSLKRDIRSYIKSQYGFFQRVRYEDWYVGIAEDEDSRKKGHKSSKDITELEGFNSWQARSFSNARTVEQDLCEEFELENCNLTGGATEKSKKVYVYNLKKSQKER